MNARRMMLRMRKLGDKKTGLICVVVSCLGVCSAQDLSTPGPGVAAALEQLRSDNPAHRSQAERTLVRAGHPETVARLTAEMLADVEGKKTSPLELYDSMNIAVLPHVIPALPQATFNPPPVRSDLILSPVAVRMALVVTRTIDKEKSFPEATRKWAFGIEQELLSFHNKELEARSAKPFGEIQSWWEHNKEAVMAGHPADAAWLADSVTGDGSPRRASSPRDVRQAEARQDRKNKASQGTGVGQTPDVERLPGVIFWLSGILVAVIGAMLVSRVKGSRK